MSSTQTSATGSQLSPERIFDTLVAFQQSAAMKAALDLDVFSAIGAGARTMPELAAKTQASERGLRILCDFLVVRGFLIKDGAAYGLTPEAAAFLDQRSPAYMGGVRHFLQGPMIVESCRDLTQVVREGTTRLAGQGSIEPDNPIWVDFARSMVALMRPAAQGIAELLAKNPPSRVLDLAAGHGLFGITIAQRFPQAQITAVDWKAVLEVAKENAREAGVEGRYATLPGDAFAVEFGSGYDVVLATNFLHHFNPPTCETLMRKIHSALKPSGQCITLEMVPNEDRVSPPMPASFAMMMLATTPSGDAYPFSEYDKMFRAAGFIKNELHRLPMSPGALIISTRE
jgi:2-polyprenyl-3-methyl-5-hydroxy-6-metoxy-1,4-benzoquinol methylase